jgi:hypothetical protein
MSVLIENITEVALSLPYDERTILLEKLAESLDTPDGKAVVSQSWINVIRRRVEEIKSGRAELVDGPAGLARVRESLRK